MLSKRIQYKRVVFMVDNILSPNVALEERTLV